MITEDPVVVIPDMLSKNESLKEKSRLESTKGIAPKKAIEIHAKDENKKVCLRFSKYFSCKLPNTNITPIKTVIIDEDRKLWLFSL